MKEKGVSKYVLMVIGVQYVMITGMMMMQE